MTYYLPSFRQKISFALLLFIFVISACKKDNEPEPPVVPDNIPIIYISTENGVAINSREEYVYCSVRIDGKGIYDDYVSTLADSAKIKGRGNSTWIFYDKKSYRLKLGKKNSLLGLGKEKDWVLLANYRDPTYFMNAMAFDMARYMGLPYTNSNRFVEVYLNDEYIGMYQFTEQIEVDKNRVDVDETNGLLLNLDLDDGPYYAPNAGDNFYSSVYRLPVCVKHPDEPTTSQLNAIKTDFAVVEQYIKNADYTNLSKRLDIQSLIDFLIIQELTRNVELVSPRSMYMFRDGSNVYHFGPVWDFDGGFAFDWASMSTGHGYFGSQSWLMGSTNPGKHPYDAYNYIPSFFVNMFNNSTFMNEYKARWAELQPGMLDFCFAKLDDYCLSCDAAMKRNAERWPIGKSYSSQIEKMRTWLKTRAKNYTTVVAKY